MRRFFCGVESRGRPRSLHVENLLSAEQLDEFFTFIVHFLSDRPKNQFGFFEETNFNFPSFF